MRLLGEDESLAYINVTGVHDLYIHLPVYFEIYTLV